MIVRIKGILLFKKPDEIIIDVNGLGYACSITSNTYDNISGVGKSINLLTYYQVTENNHQLFAFSDETERELFLMLISVSGIGPKTAIALLSAVTPSEFKKRLIVGEVSMLTALPGIGPKTARRIIVELKDKFVTLSKNDLPVEEDEKILPELNDAYDALLALGFQMKDIKKAISSIQVKNKNINTEDIIKEALTKLR